MLRPPQGSDLICSLHEPVAETDEASQSRGLAGPVLSALSGQCRLSEVWHSQVGP